MDLIPFLEAGSWIAKKLRPKKRILVVEDNPYDTLMMQEFLGFLGFEATIADTAEAARALISQSRIWIAFVDLHLLHMNGWDLIPLIWHNSPRTVIVVTSGHPDDLARIPTEIVFVSMSKPVTVEKLERLFSIVAD